MSSSPLPILSQTNPICITRTYFPKIHLNVIHLRLGLSSGLLPSGVPTKMLYAPLTSPMRATCPAHLILLALITLIILGGEYKPCSSSLCSFLQPPVTSSLLSPNILARTDRIKKQVQFEGERLYLLYHILEFLWESRISRSIIRICIWSEGNDIQFQNHAVKWGK
jgi:hypothetical protein